MNNEEKYTQEVSQASIHNNGHVDNHNDIYKSFPDVEKFTLLNLFICLRHPMKSVEKWDQNKAGWVFLIIAACALGIDRLLTEAYIKGFGELYEFNFILFLSFIGGPIAALINLFIGSAILFLIGKIFRGKASYNQVFNAYVISSFPLLFTLPIWILEIAIFGENLFKEVLFTTTESLQLIPLFLGFSFLEVLIFGWSWLVLVTTFCYVNQFKLMKKVFLIVTCLYLLVTLIYFSINSYELFSVLKDTEISEQEEQVYESADHDESNNAGLVSQFSRANNDSKSNKIIKFFDLGNSYYDTGQYEDALDAFLKAAELGVTNDTVNVYYNIGATYYELENYTDSIYYFKQYLEYMPDDIDAYWYMVKAFGNTGNSKLEFEYLDKIIELDPSIDGLLYKGDLLTYYGDFAEASIVFDEVIENFPQNAEGYYGKARILSMHNHPDEVVSNLQKAFEIDSSFVEFALEDPYFLAIQEIPVFKEFISQFETSDNGTN